MLAVIVVRDVLRELARTHRLAARALFVARNVVGARERLERERQIPVRGVVGRLDVGEAALRVPERRLGAAENGVDARALPLAAREVDRRTGGGPVVPRRVRCMDHLVHLLGRALGDLEQLPDVVEEVDRELPVRYVCHEQSLKWRGMAWSDFFIEHEGRRVAVRDYGGEGPAMLLLHGGGATVASWDELASHLVPEFSVVGFDAHGHGHSDTPETKDARLPLREIDAVRRTLGMTRPILVGSSMGGGNAIRYAADGGECAAVVAIDGAPFWPIDEVPNEPFDEDAYRAEMAAAGWGGDLTAEELEAAVAAALGDRGDARPGPVEADQRRAHVPLPDGRFRRKPTLDYIVTMREMGNEVRRLGGLELFDRVAVPVLLLNAERGYTPVGSTTEEQRARLDALPESHPNVVSEWVDAGHLIHWEKPRLVANRIREFVSHHRDDA